MKRIFLLAVSSLLALSLNAQTWVRVNQVGYLPNDKKVAVLISLDETNAAFEVCNALTDKVVYKGTGTKFDPSKWAMKSAYRMDFSSVTLDGGYYIKSNGVRSVVFPIGADVYEGIADYLLVYMRQQRCGDNPYTDTLCHQHDGYIVSHPTRNGEHIDVTGGWHDATDYLQYLPTSATATYQMLFAYRQAKDKSVFKDEYNERGRKGANGIPDILDEAKWGLEWVDKMNPAPREMYNQIADDRDHAGFRLPYRDKVDYGWGAGTGRPVYFVTGKPQGLGKYINRTTGVSSTAGKFASTFALGAEVMKEYYPEFAAKIEAKVKPAYDFALEDLGNTQTACLVSPYFYEEDSFVDDIELAAATLYSLGDTTFNWKKQADYWGDLEPFSPWMPLDRLGNEYHHYQYYPFVNLGHPLLAMSLDKKIAAKYQGFMKVGLTILMENAKDDPFLHGVPYLWCSNNLTSAAITQARLYNEITGDDTFLEMETAMRDWLLGCNPWGTSMISGIPEAPMPGYDYPTEPHSSYVQVNGDLTYGGLVDGPIYNNLFVERAGGSLRQADEFAELNHGIAVYHEDIGDYSSNEPTVDGSAGLTYYFAEMENKGLEQKSAKVVKDDRGAIVRINPDEKNIYLIFSADSVFNGGEYILDVLKKNKIKGSFFLTGNCLRMEEHKALIERIIKEGHYVGGHSNGHVLYADWGADRPTLMSADSIVADMRANMAELEKIGIKAENAQWYLPPYEHYNKENVELLNALGIKVINYTPGTGTPADYTTPDMKSYKSSQTLIDGLYKFENEKGLNGAIVLLHPGIHPDRTDRLYERLDQIVKKLKRKGYTFSSLETVR
ncbi:MAG: glycoside hydrolase family 9 protein [Bacteroidales bacterium]|nr:glycoside hydrolase family 9 protein [Bacteroidales bacterium]MDD3201639.1 glycoside hydrolase family 9 protein [Bacteroidales bacterium]